MMWTTAATASLLLLSCSDVSESLSGDPLQFLGGENMLTGHTDAHWRAVRKAVAPAFSAGNMRSVLSHLLTLQYGPQAQPGFSCIACSIAAFCDTPLPHGSLC